MTNDEADRELAKKDRAIKVLLQKQAFHDGIAVLRKKWKIPPNGFEDNRDNNTWTIAINEKGLPEYQGDIRELMLELNLAERWLTGISYYAQDNNPNMLRVQPANPIEFKYEGDTLHRTRVHSVSIVIDMDTTTRELNERLKDAKEIIENAKIKATKSKKHNLPESRSKFDRNLKVWELYQSGVSVPDITVWLNTNTDGAYNTDHVSKIVDRAKHMFQ